MIAFLAAFLSATEPGYRFELLKPDIPLEIDLESGKYKALFVWETEGDDDPTVQITFHSQSVKYQRNPILATSAFVCGDSVVFQVKRRVSLHLWILPADLCPDLTFVYTTSIALSEQFTFTESIDSLCFFFDNPSVQSSVDFEILTRKKRFQNATMIIFNSQLQEYTCPNGHCESQIADRFFLKLTNFLPNQEVRIEAHFEGHDTQNVCGREAVPVYARTETFVGKLATKNTELICDDSFKIEVTKKKQSIYLGFAVFLVIIPIVVCACRRGHREPKPRQIPKADDFDAPKRFLADETFAEVAQ
jgi:hypothetical protein